jgi:hypothetical protein
MEARAVTRASVWSAVASAPLSRGRDAFKQRPTFVRTKAAVNAPHSKRFARMEAHLAIRARVLPPSRYNLELF